MVTGTLPLVRTDLDHGGRWTSLMLGGREWLWHRPDPSRSSVAPGDAFVDAGGLEECVPTVRGIPDHGSAWSRAWSRHGDEDVVDCVDFVLRRRLAVGEHSVQSRYRLEASPGYRFLWAAHALLDLDVGARIVLPEGAPVRLYPEAAPVLANEWPRGAPYVVGEWPAPRGVKLDQLGPDDGTAIGATVLGTRSVEIVDGPHRLFMRLDAEVDVAVSVSIWRNLGGFPVSTPYRSVGVEPMLGRTFELGSAGADDAVTVPVNGCVEWVLHVSGSS
jgi:hypothetical protein